MDLGAKETPRPSGSCDATRPGKKMGDKWPSKKRGRKSASASADSGVAGKSTSPVKKKRKSAAGGEKSTPKKKRLFKVKKAMQALEEALEEALNDRDRVMSVDECLKAVLALGNEGVAEFQQKLMLAVLKK